MVRSLIFTALLYSFFLPFQVPAQLSDAGRNLFKETKARADKGDAEAQLALGDLYAAGTGVTRSAAKAAKWHRKAAEQGLARGQYQLALDYATGEGLKEDRSEAARWFLKAAEQGLADAQLAMGQCCFHGEGVSANGVEAVEWFRKAAAQGSVDAAYQMGECYFEGTGVARDIAEGVKWIRNAAERGFAPAQNELGLCYEKGTGVEKDHLQAYKWFTLAAAHDDAHAADIRVSIAKTESFLSKEQIAEAQRLALEFKPVDRPLPGESPSIQPTRGTSVDAAPKTPDSLTVGFVNVLAEDERSELFADGEFVGNPPAKLKLKDGRHLIEVKRQGFKPYQREIKVSAGSDLTLRAILEKE